MTLALELAEEDVAEGAGVPLALDRDAVRAEQVVDGRPLLVGALELELDLEPVGVGKEPVGLGHDDATLGRGPKDDRLAGGRAGWFAALAGHGANDLAIFADDFPELVVKRFHGFGRGRRARGLVGVGVVVLVGADLAEACRPDRG